MTWSHMYIVEQADITEDRQPATAVRSASGHTYQCSYAILLICEGPCSFHRPISQLISKPSKCKSIRWKLPSYGNVISISKPLFLELQNVVDSQQMSVGTHIKKCHNVLSWNCRWSRTPHQGRECSLVLDLCGSAGFHGGLKHTDITKC